MSGKICYVDPNKVVLDEQPYERDVRYQTALLEKQGMIVPLVGYETPEGVWHMNNADYSCACAQVEAARRAGWGTVILTDSAEED